MRKAAAGGKKEKYIIQQGIKRQRLTGNGEEETKRQITSQTERANKGERQLTEMDRMKIRQMTKSQKTGHCFGKRQRRILKGKKKKQKNTHTAPRLSPYWREMTNSMTCFSPEEPEGGGAPALCQSVASAASLRT